MYYPRLLELLSVGCATRFPLVLFPTGAGLSGSRFGVVAVVGFVFFLAEARFGFGAGRESSVSWVALSSVVGPQWFTTRREIWEVVAMVAEVFDETVKED